MTREAELAAALDQAVAAWGRIDILVNNAGLQFVSPLEEFPAEKFELLLRVMLIAPFLSTKRVFPLMKRQRYGRILNMASINGLVGFAGKAAYNSAKHGLIGLTRVAALEGAAHGITVNALCPGYVDTPLVSNQLADLARTRGVPLDRVLEDVIYPLVPIRRLLTPQEIAAYAALPGRRAGRRGDGAGGGDRRRVHGAMTCLQPRRPSRQAAALPIAGCAVRAGSAGSVVAARRCGGVFSRQPDPRP